MDRNYLAGQVGDATAAVGYNFRLLLASLAEFWRALLLAALLGDQRSPTGAHAA